MSEKQKTASGIGSLDELIDGLYIGDNVVWLDAAGSLAHVFCHHFLFESQNRRKPIIYISFDRSPKAVLEQYGFLAGYPGLVLLDCFTHGKGRGSDVFLKFYQETAKQWAGEYVLVENPADMDAVAEAVYETQGRMVGDVRLVFDSLTGMQELWGGEEALISFYRHSCPRLYELNTIAYWVMEKMAHSSRLKAQIGQVAQVVIDLAIKRGNTSLTVLKAAGRPGENIQKPFPYWVREDRIHIGENKRQSAGLDLGHRIRELRTKVGLSQTDLARQVGVTPSTISQVESALIYPSLPALLKMAEVLKVEVSSFFQEKAQHRGAFVFKNDQAAPLASSNGAGAGVQVRRLMPTDFDGKGDTYQVEIEPGRTVSGHFFHHKGEEIGYVLSGRLKMKLDSQSINLEPGHVVHLRSSFPEGWTNEGPDTARLFWINLI